MPTLKERIRSLTSHINEAKTSLRDALKNKVVDPGSQPSFEALRLGIERIPSGDKYKELIGKGSIFSTKLDTNETARKMVMAPDKSTVSIKVNYGLCIYNLSEDLFSYFSGYGSSTGMKNGYPWVENALFLESVNITGRTFHLLGTY